MANNSSTVLNRSAKSEHICLIPSFYREEIQSSNIKCDMFLVNGLYQVEEVFLVPRLLIILCYIL